jgi:hypothetical protein
VSRVGSTLLDFGVVGDVKFAFLGNLILGQAHALADKPAGFPKARGGNF